MNYTHVVGTLVGLAILIPAALRIFSKTMNRRLARKLATGPVGILLKHDYQYAMDLSRMVSEGDLSHTEASRVADNWLSGNKKL
jgi:hypothetical protein